MCKFANFPRFSDYLVYLGFYETHYYALFERNLVGTWNITLHQYWNSNFIVFFSVCVSEATEPKDGCPCTCSSTPARRELQRVGGD